MVNDIVADTLIRIKNGYLAGKKEVLVPKTRMVLAICNLLVKSGYLQMASVKENNLVLELKYEQHVPALTDLEQISKPSLRVYVGKDKIPTVLGGMGVSVISTPQGLMTDKEAKKKGIGGELICKVW